MTQNNRAEVSDALTRPIIGIENRSAQEVFDIMSDRIRGRPAQGEWVAPNEPDDPNWHIERMDAIVRELWATNNLDLHMCDGSVRKGQTGFLDNIRDSWRHIRRALSTSHPEPSEVQVTEAMVEAGCRALFGDQRWPVGFGFEAATGAKIGMRAALTAALSQSQPAPQPDARASGGRND